MCVCCDFQSQNPGILSDRHWKDWVFPWHHRCFYFNAIYRVFVVQMLSHVWLFMTPWTAAHQTPLSSSISRRLLKLMSIESIMPSNHLILCHPLLFSPSIIPSIRVFSNESALRTRWPKYWSFISSISPSSEYSRLSSFRIDWFDLFVVQGTLRSLLQRHNLKASILGHSGFFMVQLMSTHGY